jgi:hypothetical protein
MKATTAALSTTIFFYSLIALSSLTNCNSTEDEVFIDTLYVIDTITYIDTVTVNFEIVYIREHSGYVFLGIIDSHAYYINNAQTSWTTANELASKIGYLVTIESKFENDSILSMISPLGDKPHVWIGFEDSKDEGSFQWVTNEEVKYTNWNTGEPNNQNNEDYTIMHGSNHTNPGSWGDQPNSVNLYKHLLEVELN